MNCSKLTKEEEEEEEAAMELELGLKLTRTADVNLTSTADVRMTKNPSAPLFVSKETDSKFILTGHIRGYRKENIDIEINESGNRIAISGRRPVQEMLLTGLFMQKKAMEIRAFTKVFGIPDGVILDKIKAKFSEESSDLTILMPKKFKGFSGILIDEVKEMEVDRGRIAATEQTGVDKEPEMHPVAPGDDKEAPSEEKVEGKQDPGQVLEPGMERQGTAEEIPEVAKPEEVQANVAGGGESRALGDAAHQETNRGEAAIQEESTRPQVDKAVEESPARTETEEEAKKSEGLQKQEASQEIEELAKPGEPCQTNEPEENHQGNEVDSSQVKTDAEDESSQELMEKQRGINEDAADKMKKNRRSKKIKPCPPLVAAGSALLVSLIVLVFQLIRSKKRE